MSMPVDSAGPGAPPSWTALQKPVRKTTVRPDLDAGGLFASYEVRDVLGNGAFGIVYACRHRSSGIMCAVKMVDKAEAPIENIEREVELLSSLTHSNIVKFHQVISEKVFVCVVMDLYRGGDLVDGMKYHRQRCGKTMPCGSIVHIVRQVVEAVRHIHAQGIVHRDIKGDNYLSDRFQLIDPECKIALADFGTALALRSGERLAELVGTPQFRSPEMWRGNYGMKVDIWATGVLIYGLLTNRFPFKTQNDVQVKSVVFRGEVDASCMELVIGLLERDEVLRVDAEEMRAHPWLAAPSPDATPPTMIPPGPRRKRPGGMCWFCCSTERDEGSSEAMRQMDSIVEQDAPEPVTSHTFGTTFAGDFTEMEESGDQEFREARAGEAMAERRQELIERLEVKFQRYSLVRKPKVLSKFREDAFSVEGSRTRNVVDRYEWLTEARVEEEIFGMTHCGGRGRITVTGKAKKESLPVDVLRSMLEDHSYDVEGLGTGGSKSLEHLAAEVHRGKSQLLLDASSHKKLVRVVEIVLLRICFPRPKGQEPLYLVELSTRFPDGRQDHGTRLPGRKKQPEENTRTAARRVLDSVLDMAAFEPCLRRSGGEVYEEEEVSKSFPGIPTVYRKEHVEYRVLQGSDAKLLGRFGLPSGSDWGYRDWKGNAKYFGWFTEAECMAGDVKLFAPEADEVSSLVLPPVGLGDEALEALLRSAGMDLDSFGRGHARALRDLSDELSKGESTLTLDKNGQVLRVVDLVLLRLEDARRRALVHVEQAFPDGHRVSFQELTGIKARPDENMFHAAWRLVRALKIDEDAVVMDTERVIVADDDYSESQTYPGLHTIYRKKIVTARLIH